MPLIGWCWYFTESIFITRKIEKDEKILIESMNQILEEYPKDYYFNVI
jgi:hypothetical protein